MKNRKEKMVVKESKIEKMPPVGTEEFMAYIRKKLADATERERALRAEVERLSAELKKLGATDQELIPLPPEIELSKPSC